MTKTFNFTKKAIKELPIPEKGRTYYKDEKERGLSLYITEKGVITFFVRKRIHGKDERIILGNFPEMSVEGARKEALGAKTAVANGKNPNEEKHKLRADISFGEMFHQYMERYSKPFKRSWQYDEREVKKFLSHWFGRKALQISKQDVQRLHESVHNVNGLYQANRLLERIRAIYNKAIEWGWEGANPAQGIKKFKEKSRDRFLQPHELPYFFEALDQEENTTASDYIMLSLLTGARKSNMLAMRWDQISTDQAQWRIPETKNGEALTLPLSSQALDILNRRKAKKRNDWVFPSETSESGHFEDPKKAWKRILLRAECYHYISLFASLKKWNDARISEEKQAIEGKLSKSREEYQLQAKKLKLDSDQINMQDLRIHDLRRSLGSWQAVTGANSYVIGKSLGHKSQQATAIYARLNLDPVRESVERATAAMLQAGRKG